MKSWTTLNNLAVSITGATDTNDLALLSQYVNESIKTVCNIRGGQWWFLESTKDVATVASQQGYQVPNKFRKITDVYVTVGSGTTAVIYTPTPVFDPNQWKIILASRLGETDVAQFYYREGNKILIAPTPATSDNTITFRGRINVRDFSIADYTTGTITSIANGGTAIVGSGTTWTADMVGRFIKITETSAANGGDGYWYEIGSFTDATHIGLLKPYEGTSISAGTAAYTIGQMSPIPDAYDVAPVYRAVALYFDIKQNQVLSGRYWGLYDGGNEAGLTKSIGGLIGQMIDNESETVEENYISPNRLQILDPNWPPRYPLTGF